MKKSNKLNPDELLKDTDKLIKFINNLDNLNLETVNIEELEEEISLLEKQIKEKYKDVLPENPEDYLDSEE